jgi:hypothetical protein
MMAAHQPKVKTPEDLIRMYLYSDEQLKKIAMDENMNYELKRLAFDSLLFN